MKDWLLTMKDWLLMAMKEGVFTDDEKVVAH